VRRDTWKRWEGRGVSPSGEGGRKGKMGADVAPLPTPCTYNHIYSSTCGHSVDKTSSLNHPFLAGPRGTDCESMEVCSQIPVMRSLSIGPCGGE
jgi:hypothetical protein